MRTFEDDMRMEQLLQITLTENAALKDKNSQLEALVYSKSDREELYEKERQRDRDYYEHMVDSLN